MRWCRLSVQFLYAAAETLWKYVTWSVLMLQSNLFLFRLQLHSSLQYSIGSWQDNRLSCTWQERTSNRLIWCGDISITVSAINTSLCLTVWLTPVASFMLGVPRTSVFVLTLSVARSVFLSVDQCDFRFDIFFSFIKPADEDVLMVCLNSVHR